MYSFTRRFYVRKCCQNHMVDKVMGIIINSRIVIRAIIPRHSCFLSILPSKIQQSFDLKLKHSSKHMASNEFANSRIWQPEELINGSKQPNTYACMVINRKITVPADLVEVLWQNAAYRCTVDGGTNRWRDFLLLHQKSNKLKLPDFITGDFDSVTKDTLEYFNDPRVEVIHTPDQNFTDFTKAIHILEPHLLEKGINDIYVLHDTSGRTDHIMGNIQTLYKTKVDLNVYLISGTSITWAIRPGSHTIHIPKDLVDHTRWCALLPVGSESIVTTKGLKWDLDKSLLAFEKGIVSTSNSYSSHEVNIKVDATVLWSMGVFNFHDD